MNESMNTNRTVIIAAMDRTRASDAVLYTATSLAQTVPGAELHFVHVIPAPVQSGVPMQSAPTALLEDARAFVDGITASAAERFRGRIAGHLAVGDASREILQLASDLEADLVVVGSHGKRALERVLAGSVSHSVVKKAHCAVLVARPKHYMDGDVPEIEPPCPDCLEVQRATHGDKLWCAKHEQRHAHGRTHYETAHDEFGMGWMLLRPGTST